jgi:RimJ/RimL family protein N-acetyltransferase
VPGNSFGSSQRHVRLHDDALRLRPLRASDYDWLYANLVSPAIGGRWVSRGTTPSHEEFRRLLWQGIFAQYIIETVDTRRPVGLVSAYNVSLRNGIGYLSAFSLPRFVFTGAALRGAALLVDYLFDNWPFRKLYVEGTALGVGQVASLLGTLLEEEGRLREFEYSKTGYIDFVIAALGREKWRECTKGSTVRAMVVDMLARERRLPERVSSGSMTPQETLTLDEFCVLVGEVTGFPCDDVDKPLSEQGADSLHVVELIVLVEELTSTVVSVTDCPSAVSIRSLYALYMTHASMPPIVSSAQVTTRWNDGDRKGKGQQSK